jgi:pterin-4a-carbinolamine dehydratase
MTDEQAGSAKASRLDMLKDWEVSADGRSVTRNFAVTTPREAAQLTGRIVAISCKRGLPVDIHCTGTALSIGLPRSSGFGEPKNYMDSQQRQMARRMDRLLTRRPKAEDGEKDGDAE